MSATKYGLAVVALGFPIYLAWKGRLNVYLSFAGPSGVPGSNAYTGTATLGTSNNPTTYGPMGTPTGPAGASGLTNIPIPGL